MVFPFGVSVGDFIAGIKLFKDAIKSLSDAHGARADYVELQSTLKSLDMALNATCQFDSALHQVAVDAVVRDCKKCIAVFLVDVAKFELLRDKTVTTGTLINGLRKIQWSLCKKEEVQKFKRSLESHVSALQLLLLTFQTNAQSQTAKIIQTSNDSIDALAATVATSLKNREELAKDQKDTDDVHAHAFAELDEHMELNHKATASELRRIRQRLQYGLTPEEGHTMLRLLEEAVAERRVLEQRLDLLAEQNRTLENHLIELKAAVHLQREIPAQVMLRRPVILIDTFEENRLPFHLEFINSFEALLLSSW